MKVYQPHTLFSLIVISFFLAGSAKSAELNKPQDSQPLDLIIILDNGSELYGLRETGNTGAARETLAGAIRDRAPFLASSTLLTVLLKESSYLFKILTNNKQWFMYTDSTNQFTIGLPRHYLRWENILIANDLEKIGLNKNNLEWIAPDTLTEIYAALFEKEIDLDKPLDIAALKNIFAKKIGDSWDPIDPFSRKRLFLFGHGYYDNKTQAGMITGLSIEHYRDFLKFLNQVNTDILYVISCFAGGNNLLKAYQLSDESISKPLSLNYFLVIGSVTDTLADSAISKIDFTDFFQSVDHFFSPKKDRSMRFEDIIKPMWGKIIHNIPSIRFPGSINYFKAVDIDKYVLPITYTKATAHILRPKIKLPESVQNAYDSMMSDYREGKKIKTADAELVEHYLIEATKENKIKPPAPINAQAKTILLYPMQLKTPLIINFPSKKFTPEKLAELELGKYPAFISMIPGTAAHLISDVTTQGALDLRSFVYMFFVLDSAFEKLFLIQHLSTKNFDGSGITSNGTLIMNNVVIFKNEHKSPGTVLATIDNKIYQAQVNYKKRHANDELDVVPTITPFTLITPQEAQKIITELILKSQPTQYAVSQASGGQENQQGIMEKMLSIFVP